MKEVIKFALCCEDFEFKAANITCPADVWDEYEQRAWENPDTIREFTNKEYALATLERCENVARLVKCQHVAVGTLYFVEEMVYSEDGEFIQSNGRYTCDNWDFDEKLTNKEA